MRVNAIDGSFGFMLHWLSDSVFGEPLLGEQITVGNMEGIPVYYHVCADNEVARPKLLVVILHIFVLFSLKELSFRDA